jgi:uncharacterized protein (DUF2236 family)
MYRIVESWRRRLRATFNGGSTAPPQWSLELADGNDAGYFRPDSAAWAVHGSMSTVVAGIGALLIQSLHPGAMAGVYEHSNFREELLPRFASTIRWIFTVTYGDTAAAKAACNHVLHVHEPVTGTYLDARGATRSYSANDPHLLSWIHLAFVDAFLAAHKAFGGPIPGGPDAYVADWAIAGELMRVPGPPRTEAELQEQLAAFDAELLHTARVEEAVRLLRDPPLPPGQRLGCRILFAAAVSTLQPKYRRLLGLEPARLGPVPLPVRTAARVVLGIVRLGLGRQSSSEAAALRRLRRLGDAA